MPKSISIKDFQGFDVLKFEDIKLMYDDDFKRIVFRLSINFEFFNATAVLDAEESDFMSMKECLQKIYNREWQTFIFNPIGEQFNMQFDSLENNQIKVLVKLTNPMFTGKLEFEYKMNSIYVPDLLKEIEMALKY